MRPCLYCSAESFDPWIDNVTDRFAHVEGRWKFFRCRQCGSAVISPFPQAGDLPAFYPASYGFTLDVQQDGPSKRLLKRLEYRLYFQPQYDAQARRILRALQKNDVRGRRLLDIGCGEGLRLMRLRRCGFDVHGMDFRRPVVENLQKQHAIAAACADISDMPSCFSRESFDVVCAFHVLEHVPDVRSALRNCFALLKPGGWFVGAVPLADSLQARLLRSRWVGVTEAPRHVSLPSREGIAMLSAQVGFRDVSILPDGALDCAALWILSLFPVTATAHRLETGFFRACCLALFALIAGLLVLPWCFVENYLLASPPMGIVFARKPHPQTDKATP